MKDEVKHVNAIYDGQGEEILKNIELGTTLEACIVRKEKLEDTCQLLNISRILCWIQWSLTKHIVWSIGKKLFYNGYNFKLSLMFSSI